MTRIEILKAIHEFVDNSNVDPDSQLYANIEAAVVAIMTNDIQG